MSLSEELRVKCMWCFPCAACKEVMERAAAKLDELETDAARWRHVRTLAQIQSPHMGGEHYWRFGPLRYGRGPTVDEAVDAEIKHDAKEHA